MEPRPRRKPILFGLGILASYQVLSTIVLWPLITRGFASSLPFGTDAVLDSWGYSWLPYAITHGQNPFFTTYVNFPDGVNLLANTTQLALALVEWPVTAVFGPIASFNLACLVAPTLSAGAMYLLCSAVTKRRILAWLGGLLYGFSAYEMTSLGSFHFQLFFAPSPPLLFLALHELLSRRRPRPWVLGLGIAGLVIAQFFISTELLLMTAIMVAGAAVLGAALTWRATIAAWRYLVVSIGTAAGASVIALAYPLWMAMAGPGHVKGLVILTPQAYRADLLGIPYPTTTQAIAPSHVAEITQHFATAVSENYSYLGIPLLLVVLVGAVVLRKSRTVIVAMAVAIVGWVLSLGGGLAVAGLPSMGATGTEATGTWIPGRLIEALPLLENIIPSRWALFTAIAASVVFVALVDRILGEPGTPRGALRPVAVAAISIACVVPLIPRLPLGEAAMSTPYNVPAHLKKLAAQVIPNGAGVITYPYPTVTNNIAPVIWQSSMGFPFKIPAAYFRVPQGPTGEVAFDPIYGYGYSSYPAQVLYQLGTGAPPPYSESLRLAFLQPLNDAGIHWLAAEITGAPDQAGAKAYLVSLLGRPVAHKGDVSIFKVPKA